MAIHTRRHVTLLKSDVDGRISFELLGPSGRLIEAFSIFMATLRNAPRNTVLSYSRGVADFLDFYYEAGLQLLLQSGTNTLSRSQLLEIINSWQDYLLYGANAASELVQAVNSNLPSPMVQKRTSANKHAALAKFLELSNKVHHESLILVEHNLLKKSVDPMPLLANIALHLKVSPSARAAMLRTSMLSGVIAGGPTELPVATFPSRSDNEFDFRKNFPLDKFEEFIGTMRLNRDKALYSLYAACGCRGSEGRQLLWTDIDFEKRSVRLVNPSTRLNHPSYLALTPSQRARLAWKGRITETTMLIEPFASMFFSYLEAYLRDEYFPHGKHDFVFQVTKGREIGKPYFLTDTKSRQQVFNKASARIGLDEHVAGPHSLRSAYGTYLLNYLPVSEHEYGMPIGLVRVALGHASVASTERYAMADRDLLELKIRLANSQIFQFGNARSYKELKLSTIQAEISRLKKIAQNLDLSNND